MEPRKQHRWVNERERKKREEAADVLDAVKLGIRWWCGVDAAEVVQRRGWVKNGRAQRENKEMLKRVEEDDADDWT